MEPDADINWQTVRTVGFNQVKPLGCTMLCLQICIVASEGAKGTTLVCNRNCSQGCRMGLAFGAIGGAKSLEPSNVCLARMFVLYQTIMVLMALLLLRSEVRLVSQCLDQTISTPTAGWICLKSFSSNMILAASFLQETADASSGRAAEPDPKRFKQCNDDSQR